MTKPPRDVAASVRSRLLKMAQEQGDDFQLLLVRYANERFLYRLSISPHASRFVLKGAALFTVWKGQPHRATRDLDFLGFGSPSEKDLSDIFQEIIEIEADDGIVFEQNTITVSPIREDQAYGGIRITLVARITSARIKLQIDIGFGDAVTPDAEIVDYPTLFDLPSPHLRVYPRETVIAEKLNAMVQLDLANSRMKDFYDIYMLSRWFDFDSERLVRAIRATFERRKTPIPLDCPVALTSAFAQDAHKITQWQGFIRKSEISDAKSLVETIEQVSLFLQRPLYLASRTENWDAQWNAGGPWRQNKSI